VIGLAHRHTLTKPGQLVLERLHFSPGRLFTFQDGEVTVFKINLDEH